MYLYTSMDLLSRMYLYCLYGIFVKFSKGIMTEILSIYLYLAYLYL